MRVPSEEENALVLTKVPEAEDNKFFIYVAVIYGLMSL